MRPEHWVKNLLVFLPALLNHHIDWHILNSLVVTFLAFSCVSSATYISNDLFDLAADRNHPYKCKRPLANGELSVPQGIAFSLGLGLIGALLGCVIGVELLIWLVSYVLLTFIYSSFLKGKRILDVIILASLYTLRVYAGGAVGKAHVSPWLLQFSICLFLSLAFVKRFSEMQRLSREGKLVAPGRNYRSEDLSMIGRYGIASGMLAVVVLGLYVNGHEVQRLYPRYPALWALCPLFIYWISRVWLVAYRGKMKEDPILWAFRDRVSYVVGFMIVITWIVASAGHVY